LFDAFLISWAASALTLKAKPAAVVNAKNLLNFIEFSFLTDADLRPWNQE